jgi:hypothetical protein
MSGRTSTPSALLHSASRSATSASTSERRVSAPSAPSRERLPDARLSKTLTRRSGSGSASKRSTTCEPITPAPPMMRKRCGRTASRRLAWCAARRGALASRWRRDEALRRGVVARVTGRRPSKRQHTHTDDGVARITAGEVQRDSVEAPTHMDGNPILARPDRHASGFSP